jgi:hypothetical protein
LGNAIRGCGGNAKYNVAVVRTKATNMIVGEKKVDLLSNQLVRWLWGRAYSSSIRSIIPFGQWPAPMGNDLLGWGLLVNVRDSRMAPCAGAAGAAGLAGTCQGYPRGYPALDQIAGNSPAPPVGKQNVDNDDVCRVPAI